MKTDQYIRPSLALLDRPADFNSPTISEIDSKLDAVRKSLKASGAEIGDVRFMMGRSVTLVKIYGRKGADPDTLLAKVQQMAMTAGMEGFRVFRADDFIGLEVASFWPSKIYFRELFYGQEVRTIKAELPVLFGMNVAQRTVYADLDLAPNILISGGTHSERINIINEIILSLLFLKDRNDYLLSICGSEGTALGIYSGLPETMFFNGDNRTECSPQQTLDRLKQLHKEIDRRYELCWGLSFSIRFYNEHYESFWGKEPYIIAVVDNYSLGADDKTLSEIEKEISEITHNGSFMGVYLIVSSSVSDLTSLNDKTNFPIRIALRTSSPEESAQIINEPGAECLMGNGDMLFWPLSPTMRRIQAATIDASEVRRVIESFR